MGSKKTVMDEADELIARARSMREEKRDEKLVAFLLGRVRTLDDIQAFLGGVSRQIVHLRLHAIEANGHRVWSPSPGNPRRYFIPGDEAQNPKGV